jgi:hypothetical protein
MGEILTMAAVTLHGSRTPLRGEIRRSEDPKFFQENPKDLRISGSPAPRRRLRVSVTVPQVTNAASRGDPKIRRSEVFFRKTQKTFGSSDLRISRPPPSAACQCDKGQALTPSVITAGSS